MTEAYLKMNQLKKKASLLDNASPARKVEFVKEIAEDNGVEVFFLLIERFDDAPSRSAVRTALLELVKHDLELEKLAQLSHALAKESVKISDLMTVLEWVNAVFIYQSHKSSSEVTKSLIYAQGHLLRKIIEIPGTNEKKTRQTQSALRSTRTCLFKSMTHNNPKCIEFSKFVLDCLLEGDVGVSRLVSLAVLAGASTDLFPSNPGIQYMFNLRKLEIYDLYIEIILKSRTALPIALITSLDPFFSEYLTQEDFDTILAPAITVSLEANIVLDAILPGFIKSMPRFIDPSVAICTYLFESLLRHLDGLYTFKCLLANMESNAQKIDEVVSKLVSSLGSVNTGYIADAMASVVPNKSSSLICKKIGSIIRQSELKEQDMESLVAAYFKHVSYNEANGEIIRFGVSGPFQKIWILAFADSIVDVKPSTELTKLVSKLTPDFLNAWGIISKNPGQAVANKTITMGVAIGCLAEKYETLKSIRGIHDITFEMLITVGDWAIRLFRMAEFLFNRWVFAWIFYILAGPPDIQRFARTMLAKLFENFAGRIVDSFNENLLILVNDPEHPQIPRSSLPNVLTTMYSRAHGKVSIPELKYSLSHLLTLAHHRNFHIKGGWVGLCHRVGIDPNQLVEECGEEYLVKYVFDVLTPIRDKLHVLNKAALETCYAIAATIVSLDRRRRLIVTIKQYIIEGFSIDSVNAKIVSLGLVTALFETPEVLVFWYSDVMDHVCEFLRADAGVHFGSDGEKLLQSICRDTLHDASPAERGRVILRLKVILRSLE